jgi:Domain of unknown function (DUF4258)
LSDTLAKIRAHAQAGRIRVSEHGMQELSNDNISLEAIIGEVEKAQVVEDYPSHCRGPCVLCLQWEDSERPIHVLWGLAVRNPHVATVITAYRPDPTRWTSDLMTRKPR